MDKLLAEHGENQALVREVYSLVRDLESSERQAERKGARQPWRGF
jgi:hypothetical protein